MTDDLIRQELAKNTRRIDQLQKSLDLLNADREILENIQSRLTALEEQVRMSRQHDELTRKDVKEEISMVAKDMGDKVDEIHDALDKKKIIKIKPLSWGGKWRKLWKR